MRMTRIVPCLWFADQAEQAAEFYTSIFKNSRILNTTRYGTAGFEVHQRPAGSVMTVDFELDGQTVHRPQRRAAVFKFTEAVSLQVDLRHPGGGRPLLGQAHRRRGIAQAQQCGWLKDKFGLSWQVVPVGMQEMLSDPMSEASSRAMTAMLEMKKIDLGALQRACKGEGRPEPVR
jgi:predicted 3-demethylubiquinone-9 3-methyltransferase (glyoxalase superfamily)